MEAKVEARDASTSYSTPGMWKWKRAASRTLVAVAQSGPCHLSARSAGTTGHQIPDDDHLHFTLKIHHKNDDVPFQTEWCPAKYPVPHSLRSVPKNTVKPLNRCLSTP